MNEIVRRGQVTVLVLLLALLGITGALSVASRSLSDLHQVSQVETGTKALAAAEAGLQKMLSDLNSDQITFDANGCSSGVVPGTFVIDGIATNGLTYQVCGNTADYAWQNEVNEDGVFEVSLEDIQSNNVKDFSIVWDNPQVAVEVIYVRGDGSIVRKAYNGSSNPGNGFLSSQADSGTGGCITTATPVCAPGFQTAYGSARCVPRFFGADQGGNGLADDRLIRIKPLYGSAKIAICSESSGGSPGRLGVQHFIATVSARMADGTIKKVSATRESPALPSVFDNVIFSAGSIIK